MCTASRLPSTLLTDLPTVECRLGPVGGNWRLDPSSATAGRDRSTTYTLVISSALIISVLILSSPCTDSSEIACNPPLHWNSLTNTDLPMFGFSTFVRITFEQHLPSTNPFIVCRSLVPCTADAPHLEPRPLCPHSPHCPFTWRQCDAQGERPDSVSCIAAIEDQRTEPSIELRAHVIPFLDLRTVTMKQC